ncbi:protein-L-isoaspartate(D-aspartate) O-methyltransferase [Streptomyces sp. NPDC002917]|uniref:protein-L-isoaspartate(D-aspartate) O-methyltransferase n=1 Tax=Streptomyces sp. NPDC002917 TaxID=3364671 RepID=UPI0036CABB44
MDVDWEAHARRLADTVLRPESRWWKPIASTPRHIFVPRWWERAAGGRALRDGATDVDTWLKSAYADATLVTRIGPAHADHAEPGQVIASGRPTSSSTLPTLVVTMHRHAMIGDGCRTLVTTGTGYSTALACHRLGDELVTSVDIDDYLVKTAADRLRTLGLHPHTAICDVTGALPGQFDRIVSTVSVRPVPRSWLNALRPGGRLVTTITGTGLILVADKTADGGAHGYISYDGASFMTTRHGDDYDDTAPAAPVWEASDSDGETVSTSRYPLLYVPDSWAVRSMLELEIPRIEHRTQRGDGGGRTVWMAHSDGSWARASANGPRESPTVHQGGPRRLWDTLEDIRDRLNTRGELPVYGSTVTITPDGETTLSRGRWSVTL